MEYLFSAIVGWVVSNILNRFFFRARKTDQIIEVYEGRLAEKDKSIEILKKEQKRRTKERYRVIQALKRSGLSTDKLIDTYDKPLNAILISYASQKELTPRGRLRESHFIRPELERYNVKYLGGSDSLIPPAKVPKYIKNSDDLQTWFDSEILKGRYCKLKFLVLLDLRKKAFWNSNLPYKQTRTLHRTLGEVLSIEDLFTEEQINKIALSEIIRNGDIAWLASHVLSESELAIIHKNQSLIEKELGHPSLRLFSSGDIVDKVSTILARYGVSNAEEVSNAIVKEAKFWHSRLR